METSNFLETCDSWDGNVGRKLHPTEFELIDPVGGFERDTNSAGINYMLGEDYLISAMRLPL